MYFVYSFLMVALGLAQLPLLLVQWRRFRRYLPGLAQRFGRLPASLRADGRPTIWIHACSVGETLSAQPLVHLLSLRFPGARFVFSSITHTGQEIAKQRFSKYGAGSTFFFPVDLASIGRRVIDWIQPTIVVIIDTEIWPNFLRQLDRRGVPAVLVNGRISAASFPRYRLFRPALRRVFRHYRILIMKSEEDAARIRAIGAPAEKVLVTGNLKYDGDQIDKEVTAAQVRGLQEALGLDPDEDRLIVAGSTHPGEEDILLEVLRRLRLMSGLERTQLLVAPRHPDRFESVAVMAARAGFRVRRRSGTPPVDKDAEVLVLDTIGELAAAYKFATAVFVGGTLIPRGGHSIMEPAIYAKPIVIGPSMENFRQTMEEFLARGGIKQISADVQDKEAQTRQLTESFAMLLQDASAREALGKAAYSIFEGNRGATRRTVEKIATLFLTRST